MPHVPLFRSKGFVNKSRLGIYGDVIEEIDWSVGQIISKLKKLNKLNNTYIVFTSDNGPGFYTDHMVEKLSLLDLEKALLSRVE